MAHGRKALCDVCHKVRPNCQWIERTDSGNRYHACEGCRQYWQTLRLLKELDVMAGEHA